MDRKEFRALIKHCFLMGKNTAVAKQWLAKHYGDPAPGKSTIIDWYAEFKRWLFADMKKMLRGKEIWLKRKSDCRN